MSLTHAGGLVYKKQAEKILFLVLTATAKPEEWVLPKGHIEKGETPDFTAIREVLEESGVLAMPVKIITDLKFERMNEEVMVRYFLMKYKKEVLPIKEERVIKWVGKDEAIQLLTYEDSKVVIRSVEL